MSDCRLETKDFEERGRLPVNLSCNFDLPDSPQETGKIEEINLNLSQLSNRSHPQSESQESCSEGKEEGAGCLGRGQVRAQYRISSQCPEITIQYRILQTLKQQKSLRTKNQKAPSSPSSRKIRKSASNQTKNIAKNYGKAIIAFIQKNKKVFRAVCKHTSTPYQRITEELAQLKGNLTTVMGFRKVWTNYKYSECMRVVSHIFLRKSALGYIFNSKVANIQTHIKYRNKFLYSLVNPAGFDHIKDY